MRLCFRLAVLLSLFVFAVPSFADLSVVGKGIRKKKLFPLIHVQVYEAEFLVSDREGFKRALGANVLDAISKMEQVSLRLKFLRSLEAAKVRDSFFDALKANKVDPAEAKMAEFLKKIEETPTYNENKTVVITADLKKGVITYENPDHKVSEIKGSVSDITKILSIWFGVPADDGLAALKDALTGKGA